MSAQVTVGARIYSLWFPVSKGPKSSSPHTYLVEGQESLLLFRSVLVGAVVQRSGKNARRVWVTSCGLRNGDGDLVGYLMGLYKYKCHNNPIWSDVYDIKEKELVVFSAIKNLYDFYCDTTVSVSIEAINAHKEYLESKRWFEKGELNSILIYIHFLV
jgi:hypothetical protein